MFFRDSNEEHHPRTSESLTITGKQRRAYHYYRTRINPIPTSSPVPVLQQVRNSGLASKGSSGQETCEVCTATVFRAAVKRVPASLAAESSRQRQSPT